MGWKAFNKLKSVLASVAIWRSSKRASLEQFGHCMVSTAAPRLDACLTPQQTAEVNAFDCNAILRKSMLIWDNYSLNDVIGLRSLERVFLLLVRRLRTFSGATQSRRLWGHRHRPPRLQVRPINRCNGSGWFLIRDDRKSCDHVNHPVRWANHPVREELLLTSKFDCMFSLRFHSLFSWFLPSPALQNHNKQRQNSQS